MGHVRKGISWLKQWGSILGVLISLATLVGIVGGWMANGTKLYAQKTELEHRVIEHIQTDNALSDTFKMDIQALAAKAATASTNETAIQKELRDVSTRLARIEGKLDVLLNGSADDPPALANH